MDAILDNDFTFADFGRDWLLPYPRPLASRVWAASKAQLQLVVRQQMPRSPGIYGFVNAQGKLVYVGKSKSLRNRVLSYFLPNSEEDKAGQIAAQATEVLWETQPSEFAALIREQKLISRWQPRYNVIGMPRRQRAAFLCVGRGPAETFYVTNKVDKKARYSEGPFHGLTRLTRVAEILNRLFQLRDCKDKTKFTFDDQLSLFDDPKRAGCLRVELGTCLGPCASFCSRRQYENQVLAAIEFLRAGKTEMVAQLEQAMFRASQRMHFELAARLREDLQMVQWITKKLVQNEQARRQYNFIFPVAAVDGRDTWYLIRGGKVEHAVARPRTATQWKKCHSEIQRWAACTNSLQGLYDGGAGTLHIVAAWFRQNQKELQKVCSIDSINNLKLTV